MLKYGLKQQNRAILLLNWWSLIRKGFAFRKYRDTAPIMHYLDSINNNNNNPLFTKQLHLQ